MEFGWLADNMICAETCSDRNLPWNPDLTKCKNDGKCEKRDDWWSCSCDPDQTYIGTFCEDLATTCDDMVSDSNHVMESGHCKNGGTCEISGTNFECECVFPFYADQCQFSPCDDMASGNPCLNGGTCEIDGGGFECDCVFPYYSSTCQFSPCNHPKLGEPCLNGGTCEFVGESFKCDCPTGKTGDFCEATPCTAKPCNDGTCSVVGDSYTVSTCDFCQLIINYSSVTAAEQECLVPSVKLRIVPGWTSFL